MALDSGPVAFSCGAVLGALNYLLPRCGQALEADTHLNQTSFVALGSLDSHDADGGAEHTRLRELSEPTVEVGVLGLDHRDQLLGRLLSGGVPRNPATGVVGLGVTLLVGRGTRHGAHTEHQEENDECGDSTVYEHCFSFT